MGCLQKPDVQFEYPMRTLEGCRRGKGSSCLRLSLFWKGTAVRSVKASRMVSNVCVLNMCFLEIGGLQKREKTVIFNIY